MCHKCFGLGFLRIYKEFGQICFNLQGNEMSWSKNWALIVYIPQQRKEITSNHIKMYVVVIVVKNI